MKFNRNPVVGKRAIMRNSELSEPLRIGPLEYRMAGEQCILVLFDERTERSFCYCGVMVEHTPELEAWLNTLTPREQWDALTKGIYA